jgi:YVTN family beta-propeller protein
MIIPLTLDSAEQIFNPVSHTYGPYGLLFDWTDTKLFVACSKGADQIRIVDFINMEIMDSILIPVTDTGIAARNGPTFMTLAPDNDHLFVTNYYDNTVAVVELSTRQVVEWIHFATPLPFGIDINAAGTKVFVTCTNVRPNNGRVYVIDAQTFQKIDSVEVGSEPYGVTYKPY